MDTILLLLAGAILAVPIFSLIQRILSGKGIGWQFIRFNVLAMSVPTIALLSLHGTLDGNVAYALLAAAMGYAFGKVTD